jgi:hypothetical protein
VGKPFQSCHEGHDGPIIAITVFPGAIRSVVLDQAMPVNPMAGIERVALLA